MEETSNKTRNMVYAVLAAMAVALVCLLIFFVVPMVKKTYVAKDGFEERKLHFEATKKDAGDAKKYFDLVSELGQDRELVEKAVIGEDSIVEFIREIENISSEIGNEIEISHKKSVVKKSAPTVLKKDTEEEKKKKEAAEKEKNTVRLEVVVTGDYKQFLEFFYKLENMTYVFDIESFQIMGSKSSSGLKLDEKDYLGTTEGGITVAFVPKKVSTQ